MNREIKPDADTPIPPWEKQPEHKAQDVTGEMKTFNYYMAVIQARGIVQTILDSLCRRLTRYCLFMTNLINNYEAGEAEA